jgi:flagellar hook-associated protein 3 FlgL
MRVTANTFSNSLVDQLNRLAIRQSQLQQQAASGQRFSRPDEDPVAMRRVLEMQTEATSLTQYERNIERQQELATSSFAVIRDLNVIVDRASEIATLSDGLKSQEELSIYAAEIDQLILSAAQFANSTNRGDYLFAGTDNQKPPFTVVTDPTGRVIQVDYSGNTDIAETEIAPQTAFSSQLPGANASGAGPQGLTQDTRSGADLFRHLIELRDNLEAGNTNAISASSAPQLASDSDHLILLMGTNGALQARLETTAALHAQRGFSIDSLISNEVDADLAQTLVRLSETQTAYQAALQSGGRILSSSLLDYLR